MTEGPEPDPEAVRSALLERLADTLAVAAAEQARLRDGLIGTVAQALGDCAEAMLPALARDGFATRVAEIAAQIAQQGDWPSLTLSVNPDDRDAVEAALSNRDRIAGLAVAEDPRLAPGAAELGWPGGGARIDIDAIAATAREEFRQRLDGLASRGA